MPKGKIHWSITAAAVALITTTSFQSNAADQSLINAAKKEGALSYATNLFAPTSQKALQATFRKKFGLPASFKMKSYVTKSSAVVARVSQELKAKNVTIDWVAVNIATFWGGLKKRDELLKYCSPEYQKLDLSAKLGLLDGGCLYQPVGTVSFGIIWNPKYVKEDITSWAQLANPKYKGQLIFGDVRKSGSYLDTYIGLRRNNIWTDEFLDKIKAQEPFFDVRSTSIRDKVMTGEFPIAIFGYAPRAYQVRTKAKIKTVLPSEGVVVGGNYGGILKAAPNPNAAKLWTDFLFSKEGQELLMKYEAVVSMRSDAVPVAEVAPYMPDVTKLKAAKLDWAGLTKASRDKMRAEFRSRFGN
jgi:iron(III) transport system substrate-binding protein